MNPDTKQLYKDKEMAEKMGDLNTVPVDPELQDEAEKLLNDQDTVKVTKRNSPQLFAFAKAKKKRKAQKASRKANRRK